MRDEDSSLIRRIRAGEVERYAEIVARYEGPIDNLALRLTGDPDDAWEVSQVAFIRAYRNLHRFDLERRFFSWFYRIAYNAGLDLLAARQRQVALPDEMMSQTAAPDARVAADQERDQLDTGLRALPFDQRVVIVLRHFLDLSCPW